MRIDKNAINSMALKIIDDIAMVIYEATGDVSDSHNQYFVRCKLKSLSCGKYIPAMCPISPLPEKHGRLIDIDALPQGRVDWEDIIDAPIIVEAEE